MYCTSRTLKNYRRQNYKRLTKLVTASSQAKDVKVKQKQTMGLDLKRRPVKEALRTTKGLPSVVTAANTGATPMESSFTASPLKAPSPQTDEIDAEIMCVLKEVNDLVLREPKPWDGCEQASTFHLMGEARRIFNILDRKLWLLCKKKFKIEEAFYGADYSKTDHCIVTQDKFKEACECYDGIHPWGLFRAPFNHYAIPVSLQDCLDDMSLSAPITDCK